MIKNVLIYQNGMVAVCNEKGKQMPSLQGRWEDMAKKIYQKATASTVWDDYRAE
ncbi:unnamed protein product [marine sediment metagenome]|uniref:Uncharacterized protein n=1 Tax=marine sediment metagenome TaxID=412755 RepID=X0W363_9ZZZZ